MLISLSPLLMSDMIGCESLIGERSFSCVIARPDLSRQRLVLGLRHRPRQHPSGQFHLLPGCYVLNLFVFVFLSFFKERLFIFFLRSELELAS